MFQLGWFVVKKKKLQKTFLKVFKSNIQMSKQCFSTKLVHNLCKNKRLHTARVMLNLNLIQPLWFKVTLMKYFHSLMSSFLCNKDLFLQLLWIWGVCILSRLLAKASCLFLSISAAEHFPVVWLVTKTATKQTENSSMRKDQTIQRENAMQHFDNHPSLILFPCVNNPIYSSLLRFSEAVNNNIEHNYKMKGKLWLLFRLL